MSATSGGGYAEMAVVSAAAALPCPDALDDHQALALLGQGSTAIEVIRAAALQTGDSVLIEAAAGGVGGLLVQLARRAGATVIGLARGERKLAVAKRLGTHSDRLCSCGARWVGWRFGGDVQLTRQVWTRSWGRKLCFASPRREEVAVGLKTVENLTIVRRADG
ncbi:hypothetical protein ACSHXN_45530 (plasmid) [Streptomyces sp. HUAS TT11]|uniref:hypothetical protein n=1 Tax=Streptomyces sp. HUAS TT11 TaxID=3447508 RepID=UPI003F65A2C0